ncbi:nucleoside triphosphate pyrophosphohydrolase family protein [Tissierella creatinophila]|uniref:Nucleoside triphosphate pyrophosphohydrolase n=1 Tax=Tissierella creatinophila DSM 6911 TaxID=1123403 RepID=A0A1U7M478_TISCR|nr:nucleoside triphosphate pyrophosphohydrolase family protein [Tissierella creatinophila]OLS02019.1 nucleoside triphosphate pyrophosphohydrolase [Tissierella creatinophila DSM 6911]
MNLREYQEKSKRTLNNNLTKYEQIDNMVYGIFGESGEVVDLLKKSRFQGHVLDKDKLKEEIGDVMFYITNLCNLLGLDLEEIIEGNYNKLLRRYPEGFSSERSINRE